MTSIPFNPPRLATPAPNLPRPPIPCVCSTCRPLWAALVRQTKARGDVQSALELEMMLGGVPEGDRP